MLRPLAFGLALCSLVALPARGADMNYNAAVPGPDLSYSYVEGSLFQSKTDTAVGNLGGKGAEAWFSYSVLKMLHVFGGTKYVDFDDYTVNNTLVEAGAGWNYNPSPLTSMYFDLAAVTSKADSLTPGGPTIGVDDNGYTYLFGWRSANKSRKMEFNLSAQHITYHKVDEPATWINLGLLFRTTNRLMVVTGVELTGNAAKESLFKAGVRYYLPNRFDKVTE
jgi:hypothetical protein